MKRLTEIHVPPEWEASFLACLDPPPTPPARWLPWVYGGLFVTSGCGLAGIVLLIHP